MMEFLNNPVGVLIILTIYLIIVGGIVMYMDIK